MAKDWFSGGNVSGGSDWFTGGSSDYTDSLRKRHQQMLEDIQTRQQQEGIKAQEEASKDTRSNLQKLKDVTKDIGKGIASSYTRVSGGIAESLGHGTEAQKKAREAQSSITDSNTQLIADFAKQLKDPNLDPEKRKRIESTINKLNKTNAEVAKASNERSQQIQERTDPVKGGAAVGSIGFDVLTAGTVGSAAKGGEVGLQTGKLLTKEAAKKEAERLASEEVAKFTAKNVAKKVAIGAGQGAGSGAFNAVQEKGKDVTAKDIAKGAAIGGATGGAITFGSSLLGEAFRAGPGKALAERKSQKAYEAAKAAEDAANAGKPLQITPGGTKQLPQGKLRNESTSTTNGTGKLGAPESNKTVPVTDAEYKQRFNDLSASYDKEMAAVEKEPPLKRAILQEDINNRHMAQLDQLDHEFSNGKPNPDFVSSKDNQVGTRGKSTETGFVMGGNTPAEETAIKAAKSQRQQLHQRISQIDKIVADTQQNGTTRRTADELRALMREREQAQSVLDGKAKFEDVYGRPQETAPLPFSGESKVPTDTSTAPTGNAGATAAKEAAPVVLRDASETAPKGVRAAINRVFHPVQNFVGDTKAAFQKNAGGLRVAELKGKSTADKLRTIAKDHNIDLNFDLAKQIEDGTAPDNEFTKAFREIADKSRAEANAAGLDIGYRENYVPHIWKQDAEKVDQIARRAGLKARAEGERIIPTYEEGIKLGLTPKYKDPAEMMGDYVKNLETVRTNVALLKDLQEQGLVSKGRPQPGWKSIKAEGFPRDLQGNALTAPKEVAKVLDNIYGKSDSYVDKVLSKTSRVNSVWQDIALAGGIPKTPANFFTFSQMMKEGALGIGQAVTGHPIQAAKTIYSPTAAFVRSFSRTATRKFERENQQLIQDLAKRGVALSFSENGGKWDKLFNEPTFGRFMPNLQLSTAKNIQGSLEKKLGKSAALDQTAEIMKKMYGITDQLATGRSQAVQDAIGSIGFAPKYRESIVNVLGNTAKAVADPKTWGDRSYSLNRQLAVGLGATYLIYDQINRATMGHGMDKNPTGKELTLAIPYGGKDDKGNQKVVYIPFMPSFMTLPRAAIEGGSAIAKGDLEGASAAAGKFLSMPIQTGSQILNNKDYFGRPIVVDQQTAQNTRQEEDSNLVKWKKRAMYLAGQASPAAVRGVLDAAAGKPIEQNLAQVGEAPVRFGTLSQRSTKQASYSPGEVTSSFYDTYNPLEAKKRKATKEVTDLVKQGRLNEAKRKADEFNASLHGKFGKYYSKYGANPSDDPMWDEMLNGLFISTSERSFKARARQ